jgi:hypothetical protein
MNLGHTPIGAYMFQVVSSLQTFHKNFVCTSHVSSVSVVFDYGLDDRATGVRSPAEAKDFSFNPEVPKLWPTPRGRCWVSGVWGASCLYERRIYFERNMNEDKIYILVDTLLG